MIVAKHFQRGLAHDDLIGVDLDAQYLGQGGRFIVAEAKTVGAKYGGNGKLTILNKTWLNG